jgi:hypothetical protein
VFLGLGLLVCVVGIWVISLCGRYLGYWSVFLGLGLLVCVVGIRVIGLCFWD